jgi:hypothetical protein
LKAEHFWIQDQGHAKWYNQGILATISLDYFFCFGFSLSARRNCNVSFSYGEDQRNIKDLLSWEVWNSRTRWILRPSMKKLSFFLSFFSFLFFSFPKEKKSGKEKKRQEKG